MQARKACAAGQVERGIELLAEIIAERNDPNAVYNQARCYQGNGRPEQALARFREYLRIAPRLTPPERRQVDGFIRELEHDLDARARRAQLGTPATAAKSLPTSAAKSPPAAGPPAAAPPPPIAARPPAPSAARPAGPPTPAPSDASPEPAAVLPPPAITTVADAEPVRGRTLRILSAAGAIAGAVALGGGIYYGLKASRLERELERRGPPSIPSATFDRKWQEGKRAETRQWIAYGAAAIALGESAVLYLLARPSGRERVSLRVTPTGGAVTGRF
jgi:hypothetical protein